MAGQTKSATPKIETSAELLSYIINITPELRDEIDLPVQGQSIAPIGKLIMNNQRYKNAFINTVNLIGLTVIKSNVWDNPWNFTLRGTLNYGQQIREIINDLCDVYDYNKNFADVTKFLKNVVPNVFQYIHEVNFQKVYQSTTSDAQMSMAFQTEDLFKFIDEVTVMLYESLKYDTYIVDKYMLCRRILDGTVTPTYISNFATKSTREIVADMKATSNKMTFRKPNYNPAGIRRATSFENQITIVNTDFDAKITTEVLATSYFLNEAEMKTRLALIDSFNEHDEERLTMLLEDAYIAFTEAEKTQLKTIPAVIVSREWFMDYDYPLSLTDSEQAVVTGANAKRIDFYNPSNLTNNHFLHAWRVFSTSPFENATVFVQGEPSVTSVSVSPATATVSPGQTVQLVPTVVTSNFANKAVTYSVTKGQDNKVTVSTTGLVSIPSDFSTTGTAPQIEVTVTSVFDSSKTSVSKITVS